MVGETCREQRCANCSKHRGRARGPHGSIPVSPKSTLPSLDPSVEFVVAKAKAWLKDGAWDTIMANIEAAYEKYMPAVGKSCEDLRKYKSWKKDVGGGRSTQIQMMEGRRRRGQKNKCRLQWNSEMTERFLEKSFHMIFNKCGMRARAPKI